MTILTARGRGAIGVVRVWGRRAIEAADVVFRPVRGRRLLETPPGRLRLGRAGRGEGDEVVAVILADAPAAVEIQCHGGFAALELVVDALREAGARVVGPDRLAGFTAGSSIRAEALVDLAQTSTVRTAEVLLEQAAGALDRELEELIREIDRCAVRAHERIDRLIERGRIGSRLIAAWRIVIAGRPNVGKSRLLNALAGYERAIVDPAAGTTRDVVSARISLDGWPIELLDTAGLRPTEDTIERMGIERAIRQQEAADLVLRVFDRSGPLHPEDLLWIFSAGPHLAVASKADLLPAWEARSLESPSGPLIVVSVESGEGLDVLTREMVTRLVPEAPGAGAGVPFRLRHLECLSRARAALEADDGGHAVALIRAMREFPAGSASVKTAPGSGSGASRGP